MYSLSTRAAWQAQLAKDLGPDGLFDTVKWIEREGLFTHWSHMTVPVSTHYLGTAIDVLCGGPPEQTGLVASFLGYVRQQIERAKSEPLRWENEADGQWGAPFMKAERWYDFLSADLHGRALRGEAFVLEPQHFAALQASADELVQLPTRFWDEMSQSRLIERAVVAVAWGRPDMAQSILKLRRSFNPTRRYVDWTRSLVAQLMALAPAESVSPNSALWAHFHALFDEVRHPTLLLRPGEAAREAARRGEAIHPFSWPLLRLSLAMVKQRYLLGRPPEPGLRELIVLISE